MNPTQAGIGVILAAWIPMKLCWKGSANVVKIEPWVSNWAMMDWTFIAATQKKAKNLPTTK
tara:strand:- start:6087 stop:6269 length:183 start_codon:yes stop_codon:yes gene_type:complete